MQLVPPVTWRIPPEADPRHRHWDGEDVFFHGGAGDTHRLSAPAAAVLLRLMRGPADAAELTALLAEAAGCAADAAAALAAILEELVRLEFVEPLA